MGADAVDGFEILARIAAIELLAGSVSEVAGLINQPPHRIQ